jgi:hypothetical protein
MRWKDYGPDMWGLTASSGPTQAKLTVNGVERTFRRYWARGAALDDIRDDGTLAPTALGGAIPFAPEETVAGLKAMRDRYGARLFRDYGFVDAFNPTLDAAIKVEHGRVVPGVGWFEDDYLGIDQGPIVLMAENYRSGLVWRLMKRNPYVVRGLCRAEFTGGWLKGQCH